MSAFRTPISLPNSTLRLHHQDQILGLGSCFAQHMVQRLQTLKFTCCSNPAGISYHPLAICKILTRLLSGEKYRAEELFQHQGLWHSFDHHSQYSDLNQPATLQAINLQFDQAYDFLQGTNRLLLTLGTANVFEHLDSRRTVANCHKLPSTAFRKTRLSLGRIYEAMRSTLQALKTKLPQLEVVLSVSPVRHLRDGHLENQKSKATLILAADQLSQTLDYVHYFPAYEIMLDDLRDYRFYAADMAHPNELAIDYIWEKFAGHYFSSDTQEINQALAALARASQHRALHSQSAAHQQFLQRQLAQVKALQTRFPDLDFSVEEQGFLQQIV